MLVLLVVLELVVLMLVLVLALALVLALVVLVHAGCKMHRGHAGDSRHAWNGVRYAELFSHVRKSSCRPHAGDSRHAGSGDIRHAWTRAFMIPTVTLRVCSRGMIHDTHYVAPTSNGANGAR